MAYPLSLRNLEEMMSERGISVDHSTVHRWALQLLPVMEKLFRRRKRLVGKSWHMDETYIKINGQWQYLYRAVDTDGATVDFLLRAHRDNVAARRPRFRQPWVLICAIRRRRFTSWCAFFVPWWSSRPR